MGTACNTQHPTIPASKLLLPSSRIVGQAKEASIVVSAMLRNGFNRTLDDMRVDDCRNLAKELANLLGEICLKQ